MKTREFVATVADHYRLHGRNNMPWRENPTEYWVVVSEVMLQQTRVNRVVPKFLAFVELFSGFETLAAAKQADVVRAWSGLGYNRRAIYLHKLAIEIVKNHNSRLPQSTEELVSLPAIGRATSGSVAAFAFNAKVVFIETNIRRAVIHNFFSQKNSVDDKEILPILEDCLESLEGFGLDSRTWYWALLDYGSWLKSQVPNPNRLSKHYSKQGEFLGSKRQLRGTVLKNLSEGPRTIQKLSSVHDDRLSAVVADLAKEGFVSVEQDWVQLR